MDKLDKLIEAAKRIKPFETLIDLEQATSEELLELINKSTTDERFQEIVTAIESRVKSGVPHGE